MGTTPTEQRDSDGGNGDPPDPQGEPPDQEISEQDPPSPSPLPPSQAAQPKKPEETTIKMAQTELLSINLDQNVPLLATSPSGDIEIPIHLGHARHSTYIRTVKTFPCPLLRYCHTLFWDDVTIFWDENLL